jgi:formylglycine-generating enzyme required for sulfatase activity
VPPDDNADRQCHSNRRGRDLKSVRLRGVQPKTRTAPSDGNGNVSKKRPSRLRIAVWIAEAFILAAVLEHFVVRPRLARSEPPAPVAQQQLPPPLKPLGENAVLPDKLVEFAPAYRAPTTDLAPGSDAMADGQIEFSRESGLPVEVQNSIGMRFRLIPPGTAVIGSPDDEPGREASEVQHVVVMPEPFYLGTFEVTQSEYSAVMGTNPSHFQGARLPVEEITWYDCQRFMIALCKREGLPPGTYRLPTEAEWEYACRAGTATAFYFGNNPARLPDFAEFADNNYQGTVPVGKHPPNALGLCNMHGNVWEWCLDRFHPYPDDPVTDVGERAQWRNLRGGNWYETADNCRSANRSNLPPASHGNMLGFRLLRSLTPPAALPDSTTPATTPNDADTPDHP